MFRHAILALCVLSTIAGCGGGSVQRAGGPSEQEKAAAALSISEISSKADDALREAREKEWGLYAPRKLEELEKSVAKVRDAAERGNRKRVIEEAAKAEKLTVEGQAVVAMIQTEMAEELKMRTRLRTLKAENAYPKEYEQVATQLRELIVRTGEGKSEKTVKQRDALNAKMLALEVKVVRFNALNDAEGRLAEAKKKGAEKQAPLTWTEAIASFQSADAFIAQNPRDEPGVAEKSREATFNVNHLMQVLEAVQDRAQRKATAEQVIRDEESRLLELAQVLGQPDPRDRPLTGQVDALIESINKKRAADGGSSGKEVAPTQQDGNPQIVQLSSELAAARKENEDLRGKLAATEVMQYQFQELEKTNADLVAENVRLLAETGRGARASNVSGPKPQAQ
ncbi:MAG: hypothetical protein ACKVP2_03150 [Burkholderiales bacterium]